MKKTALMISSLLILALPLQAHAAKGGEKGPSDSAWEHANENAKFKREGEKLKKDKHNKKEKHSHDGEDDHDHDRDDRYRRDRDSDREGRYDRDHDDSDRDGRRDRDRDDSDRDGRGDRDRDDSDRDGRGDRENDMERERQRKMRNEEDRVRDGERRSGFRWPWSRDTNPAE